MFVDGVIKLKMEQRFYLFKKKKTVYKCIDTTPNKTN